MLLSLAMDFDPQHQDSEMLISSSASPIPFTSEEALVHDFSRNERFKLNELTGQVLELDARNGIADICIYELRADWQRYVDIASLQPQWTYPLIRLPYRTIFQVDDLVALACVSQKTAKNILRDYTLAGFCRKTSNGWIKWYQPRNPLNHVYAIEAKLRDWKKALLQASRYHDFAHQAWVLLDNHYTGIALKNRNEFIKRNVGLASIEKEGRVLIHIKPKTNAPRSQYRYWYATNLILNQNLRCQNSAHELTD